MAANTVLPLLTCDSTAIPVLTAVMRPASIEPHRPCHAGDSPRSLQLSEPSTAGLEQPHHDQALGHCGGPITAAMVSSPPVLSGLMAAKLARPIENTMPPSSQAASVGRPVSGNELPVRDERDFGRQSEEAEVDISEMLCLHGAKAAMRHAVTELLFFSSIGDLTQLQRVCRECKLNAGEATDFDRRTPLHLAAAEGCFSVVEWLLSEARVSPNPVDRFSRTPLEDAVRGDYGDVACLIQQHGGRVYLEKEEHLVPLESTSLYRFVQSYACPGGQEEEDLELQPEWEIDRRELKLLQVVGQGEFGTVHYGCWLGAIVAIKVLKGSTAVAVGDFRTECHVLQKIHHPHAVQFLGACTRELPYMIITEFLPGGSLSDFFQVLDRDPSRAPTLRRAVSIATDCAKGLRYMHARRRHVIVHRDLKPANIMLGGVPADLYDREVAQQYGTAKIADFGLSKSLALRNAASFRSHRPPDGSEIRADHTLAGNLTSELYKLTGEAGSYRYMAPEVFRHEPYNSKVDVYAFAMIAFELFEGRIPFGGEKPMAAAQRAAIDRQRPVFGTTNRWNKKVPAELKDLVKECWAPAAKDRPDMAECVQRLESVLAKLPPDKKKKGCSIM